MLRSWLSNDSPNGLHIIFIQQSSSKTKKKKFFFKVVRAPTYHRRSRNSLSNYSLASISMWRGHSSTYLSNLSPLPAPRITRIKFTIVNRPADPVRTESNADINHSPGSFLLLFLILLYPLLKPHTLPLDYAIVFPFTFVSPAAPPPPPRFLHPFLALGFFPSR